MKFLLTPITMFIWYLITYFAAYYGMVLLFWMFDLNWIWIILGFSFLVGLISLLVNTLPGIINNLIISFYGMNWFSVITHSLAGLIALIYFYYLLYQNPANSVNGNNIEEILLLKALWDASPLKTIILFIPFLGIQLGLIYYCVFSPIILKLEKEQNTY